MDPFEQPGHGPADPSGYRIEYATDGDGFVVIRLADYTEIGRAPTKEEAVELALADA
jgi:hypothetical protein